MTVPSRDHVNICIVGQKVLILVQAHILQVHQHQQASSITYLNAELKAICLKHQVIIDCLTRKASFYFLQIYHRQSNLLRRSFKRTEVTFHFRQNADLTNYSALNTVVPKIILVQQILISLKCNHFQVSILCITIIQPIQGLLEIQDVTQPLSPF